MSCASSSGHDFAAWCPWPAAGGHDFLPQRTGHPRKTLTCLWLAVQMAPPPTPKMFLSLILAWTGMWLPRPVARELFWGLSHLGRAWLHHLPPPGLGQQVTPGPGGWLGSLLISLPPPAKKGGRVIHQAQELNLTVPSRNPLLSHEEAAPGLCPPPPWA